VLAVNLTETDKESLRFMREEEKLARDVYHVLFDMWGSSIFNNISGSEQTHMGTIKTLLDPHRSISYGFFNALILKGK
jgi:hypothetical protein